MITKEGTSKIIILLLLLFIFNALTVEASEMLSQLKMLIDYKKNVRAAEER